MRSSAGATTGRSSLLSSVSAACEGRCVDLGNFAQCRLQRLERTRAGLHLGDDQLGMGIARRGTTPACTALDLPEPLGPTTAVNRSLPTTRATSRSTRWSCPKKRA